LSVRADALNATCRYVLVDQLPILAVQAQGFKKAEAFFGRPPTAHVERRTLFVFRIRFVLVEQQEAVRVESRRFRTLLELTVGRNSP